MPGEDQFHQGTVSVPRNVAPGTKDVTMYTADGQEIPMRVPSYWDPSQFATSIRPGPVRPAGVQYPPGTQLGRDGKPVPDSQPPPSTARGQSVDETGAPTGYRQPPSVYGGTAFGGQPTIGGLSRGPNKRGSAPPLSDRSPAAMAARQFPAASQGKERNAAQTAYEEQASKERIGEGAAQTRQDIADLRARTLSGNVQAQIAGRKDVAETNITVERACRNKKTSPPSNVMTTTSKLGRTTLRSESPVVGLTTRSKRLPRAMPSRSRLVRNQLPKKSLRLKN